MKQRSSTFPASWPALLKATGKLTGALPAIFANLWWAGFCLGLATAALWFLLGTILSPLHDHYWLPVLFRGLLSMPCRWLLTGVLMIFLVWRADVPSKLGVAVAFVSGSWLGVLMLYDVWYHYPFLIAVWAAFLSWRVGWMLWSYPGGGLVMAGLVGMVLAGAAFSADALPWDNRFTLGRSGFGNFSTTAILLFLAVLAPVTAAFFAVRGGVSPRPARPPLLDLIEREPRMSRYLDAVLAVTGNKLRRGPSGPARFLCAIGKLPKLRGDLGVFGEAAASTWGRSLQWTLAFGALKIPGVPLALKLLRTPFAQPGLRCEALARLLREGVSREHGHWSSTRDDSAERSFARGLALREALIEVSVYFGRGIPVLDLTAEVERLGTANGMTDPGKPADPVWARAAQEYEQLWFQNCERLFLTRGEQFTLPLFRLEDIVDANAIRAALKTPTNGTAWVVDQLRLSPWYQQLDLTPADPESDPTKHQIVAALNHLIEKARPARERALVTGNLMDRGAARTVAAPTNRRAEMLRMREELARAFDPALAPAGDWVDFSQLSRTWLTCRLASGGATTIHRAAADLALAVFVLDAEVPGRAAEVAEFLLSKSYLDLNGSITRAPCHAATTPEDRADAARCALLCALWQAHLGHWVARGPLTLGLIDFKDQHLPETVLRGAAHLHAAILERQSRTDAEDVLRQFETLDSRELPAGLLYEGRIPGHVLARSFADRIRGSIQ